LICVSILISIVLISNNQILSENYNDEWWNSSWNFRFRIDVNTSDYSRIDWTVEYAANFTQIFESLNTSAEFDNNSIRVIEYNASGSPIGERIMQFDPSLNYNSTNNADGELLFLLNGTTPNQTTRYFYVYFDALDFGQKPVKSYTTELNYGWDGEEFEINTSNNYTFFFDTFRGENTSGLYRAEWWNGLDIQNLFTPSSGGQKTMEWTETTDGTYNYTFDFRYNATITAGPLRVTVRQDGDEAYWNELDNKTNQSVATKTYRFYLNHTWYLLEHNITNTHNETIYRQATTGIPRFNASAAYDDPSKFTLDDSIDPGSYVFATKQTAHRVTGIINVNESNASMTAANSTSLGSIGISFPNTSIGVNQSLWELSSFVFTVYTESFVVDQTRDRLINPVALNVSPGERLSTHVEPLTNYPIYNRNETIIITGNVTFDPWSAVYSMNATLDRGTPQQADDISMVLYDDGSHGDSQPGDYVFTNTYDLNNSENIGEWNLTITYYDQDDNYLNESYYLFNVTDQFYANLTISNPTGLPRIGNATFNVMNYRQSIPAPGATVNCTTNGVDLPPTNITDNGDGTYSINFSTPTDYGLFNMSCTAQKDGNNNTDEMYYTVEAPKTNLSIILQPSSYIAYNVTWYDNESFNLHLTINNTWQSNSYDTNVTVTPSSGEIQSNITFTNCETIPISMQCNRDFNISILSTTSPGSFSINISLDWTNLDTTTGFNFSIFDIDVQSNPQLSVPETNITGIIAPGNDTVIAGFTVDSSGNDILNDTNFTVLGLSQFNITFSPVNITTLNAGQQQAVDVQVSADSGQSPGLYNGTINITTTNGGYHELPFLIIVTGTNTSITSIPPNFTSYDVTFYRNESFDLTINTTNTGNTTSFNTYINISMPASWYSNGTGVFCGNVSRGEGCSETFNITIASGTSSGNYTINSTVTWEDINIGPRSNTTQTDIIVVQNLSIQVLERYVNLTVQHGTNDVVGNFTVVSSGNDILYNITYNLTGLENLTIDFIPQNISVLTVGQNQTVNISLNLPYGFPPGNHSGTLNISSLNNGFWDLYINIDVPVNGSWTMNDTSCEHIQEPESGVACDILISNTGNIELNFSVNQSVASPPSASGYTWAEYLNFTIPKQNSTILRILYDLTGQPKAYYNYTYNISANQSQATPQFSLYNVVLNPYVQPVVNIRLNTTSIEQGGSLEIWAGVESLSGATVTYPGVTVNVTQFGGVSTNFSMWEFQSGNPSNWTTKYPIDDASGLWGNTTLRGNYTIEVIAVDSYGMNGTDNTTFNVYTKLVPTLTTGASIYEQGETVSLNYISRDFAGLVLSNVTVNIEVKNSNQETIYNKTLVTNQNGGFDVLESLSIPSDAVTGTYTATANSQYYDQDASITVYNTESSTFTVVESGGLVSDLSTTVVWYPTSTMTFAINLYDANGIPAVPDDMNLTVYVGSPLLNNIYFTARLGDVIVQEIENGFYVISFVMPANTSAGDYWAVLRASKGALYTLRNHPFRVATGGPYDVIIDYVEPEVQKGSYVDFDVIIENMGEFGQDVDIDYWITDEFNVEWARSSAAVYTPAGQNITFSNNLFIFSNQPTGLHTFHVRVTYSTLQDPIEKSTTFSVIPFTTEPEEPGPEPGGPGEGPTPGPGPAPSIPNLDTDFYRDEIGVEAGVNRTIRFRVNNTGNVDISNISLSIQGIDGSWYVFRPDFIEVLKVGGFTDINLIFTVPKGTQQGSYRSTLVIFSEQKDIKKFFTLTIFTSREALIRFELSRLKEKTSELEYDARDAQDKEGKDMSKVFAKIEEIKEQIDIAEEFLDNEMYDDALDAIYNGWELYREALYLYETAPTGLEIPWQILIILLFIIFGIVVGIYLYKQRKLLRTIVRTGVSRGGGYSGGGGAKFSEAKSVVESIQKESAEVNELKDKRDKLTRTLGLLDTQKKQGIISKEAYLSMKSSTEEKIKKIEEDIRSSIKS